jgi:glycosyltransferase involved in cell wall biosynthesis
MRVFKGKVGLVQRVVPNYRVPFFNALGRACTEGMSVFAGKPKPDEMIKPVEQLEDARLTHGKNLHIFKGSLYLCVQIGLLEWLEECNPDILIMEANPRYLCTSAAVRWMHRRERPVIGWGLGAPSLSGLTAPLRQRRRSSFIQQFDSLITYSRTGVAEYSGLGFPKDRIFVAVNAVTPAPAHPLPIRPEHKEGSKMRVLFVGRLQERKKLDNLLNACAQLPVPLQPELVIVGDGPAKGQLEALAKDIYPSTIFTGARYGNALEEQFHAADLFVLPGTGGLAIQQAMSFGLPIIAGEADGTQTDLVRPENGWQISPDDVEELKSALKIALSDISRLREMGAESYRIVAEEINLDKMVSVFVEALNRSAA